VNLFTVQKSFIASTTHQTRKRNSTPCKLSNRDKHAKQIVKSQIRWKHSK